MTSIHRFQTVALVVGVILLIALGQVVHFIFVRSALFSQLDQQLAAKASALANVVTFEPPYVEFDLAEGMLPEFAREEDPEYFEIRVNGQVLATSDSLGEGSIIPNDDDESQTLISNARLPDGRPGRFGAFTLNMVVDDESTEPVTAPKARIAIAVDRSGLDRMLARIILIDVLLATCVIAGLVGLSWWTIRRGLQPLRELSQETRRIDVTTLDHRFNVETLPRELQSIAAALNHLLDRLEAGFAREKRTTANMAHELRTPIAELRSAVDVALRWSDDPELQRRTIETARDISMQMGRLVESLLTIARVHAGEAELGVESVAIEPLIHKLWTMTSAVADERGILLRVDIKPALHVMVNRNALELMLADLLSNAVQHAPRGSDIRCDSTQNGTETTIVVTNPAPELSKAEIARLHETFWTTDAARSDGSHLGLGLTLVRTIADAAGIGIHVTVERGEFRAALRLPVEPVQRRQPGAEVAPASPTHAEDIAGERTHA